MLPECQRDSIRDLPFKMKTSDDGSIPPKPPQPALISALTPDSLTASNIVSEVSMRLVCDHTCHCSGVFHWHRAESGISSAQLHHSPYVYWRRTRRQELDQIRIRLELRRCGEKVESSDIDLLLPVFRFRDQALRPAVCPRYERSVDQSRSIPER